MELSDYPRVTVILRNAPRRLCDDIVEIVATEGLRLAIEITRNSSNFEDVGGYARRHHELPIGAGTVLTLADARAAAEAGCRFVLSPVVLAPEIVSFCHGRGLLVVSGAYSPTEIYSAVESGADIVKLFPAKQLGPGYIKDVRAPLGAVPFMAVGGVTRDNAPQWFEAGAEFVGIGSGLFGSAQESLSKDQVAEVLRGLSAL